MESFSDCAAGITFDAVVESSTNPSGGAGGFAGWSKTNPGGGAIVESVVAIGR